MSGTQRSREYCARLMHERCRGREQMMIRPSRRVVLRRTTAFPVFSSPQDFHGELKETRDDWCE